MRTLLNKMRRAGATRAAVQATMLLCLVLLAATHAAAQDSAAVPRPAPTPAPFNSLRYEEDWSYLRDPARRTDPLDRLKYIPLDKRGDYYLSLGGEVREYYNVYRNQDFGNATPDDGGYFLQRYFFNADLHLGSRVRVFGQLNSGISNDQRGGPSPVDEDKLDVNQLFVDVNLGVRGDNVVGEAQRPPLTLRVGRQELQFGSQRIVTRREGPNAPNTFDGVRAVVNARGWRIDGFGTKITEDNRGFFDDGANTGRTFWGAYATRPVRRFVRNSNLDLYYLNNDYRQSRFSQGTAREVRHTVGARVSRQDKEGWSYDYEALFQAGTFGVGNIVAWRLASDTAYTFADAPLRPRVGLIADVSSGDRDPDDPDLQTHNSLFQSGAYSGRAGILGAANATRIEPGLNFDISAASSSKPAWAFTGGRARATASTASPAT